jgi:integrase
MKNLRKTKKADKTRSNALESEISEYKSEPTLPSDKSPISETYTQEEAAKLSPAKQNGGSSKAHLRYWEDAIFTRRPGGNWWVQIQHQGRREKFSLGTPLKSAAAEKARSIYAALLANGWEDVLRVYRPLKAPKLDTTIGEFLAELASKADLKAKTLAGYNVALRKIVADIFEIDGGLLKYDYRSGGRDEWLTRIHAVRLSELTSDRVQAWKRSFLARAGKDPIKERSAKITFNSFLRRAKSLFAKKAIQHLSCFLPSPLPFTGIEFEKRQSMQYRSSIDPAKLARAAQKELARKDPPAFLAFLLALGAGLRRIEIDRLEWSAFRWRENIIRIEPTAHFQVKTEHSIGDVRIDPELMALFRGYYAARCSDKSGNPVPSLNLAASNFVIETPNLPRPRATFENYRAQIVFERLADWLRKNGVTARKPIHELRKEFGSIVNKKHGLTAAKDLLRHADIAITASHYIDRARDATSELGALLVQASKRKGKKIVEFNDAAKASTRRRSARAR